jgi:hypothetical protein
MGSVLAIISKSEFKKLGTTDGSPISPGAKVEIDRYHSSHKVLDALRDAGTLFLVTVQPDDTLWLVAMLGVPRRIQRAWKAQGNTTPVIDITFLCDYLGLVRGDGKLAMRLQTPRPIDDRQFAVLSHVAHAANAAHDANKPYKPSVPAALLKATNAKPPVTARKYVFFGKQGYDLRAVEKLDATTKKQFMAAAAKMAGKRFNTPKAFFEWEAKLLETSIDGIDIIRWRIGVATAMKQPVFDFWLFPFDDGVVFAADHHEPMGVAMSQNRFLAEGKKPKPELQAIARDLQASVPTKLV